MRIGITGRRSKIVRKFIEKVGFGDITVIEYSSAKNMPLDLDCYLLCAGVLHGKSAEDISEEEAAETLAVNFSDVAKLCDKLITHNDRAKICVIGSESGVKGSYDTVYAGAKAALHLYIETKKLRTRDQHLFCVSPTIIQNTGMTDRRDDLDKVIERGKNRRLKRWIKPEEVAEVCAFGFKQPTLCNTVIHMTGGNW